MTKYDDLESTAQRVYKYIVERYQGEPRYFPYKEIAEEIGRTRSSVSYAVGVLLRARKIAIQDGKISVLQAGTPAT